MARRDHREARRAALRNAQQAVRVFVRQPCADSEQVVVQARARLRMLDEHPGREREPTPTA